MCAWLHWYIDQKKEGKEGGGGGGAVLDGDRVVRVVCPIDSDSFRAALVFS